MKEVGERAHLEKVQDRTETALIVFDNKAGECIQKAQRLHVTRPFTGAHRTSAR